MGQVKTEYDLKNELRFMLAIFMAAIPFIVFYTGFTTEEFRHGIGSWLWLGSIPFTLFAMKIKGWKMGDPLILVLFALLFGPVAFIIVTVTIPLMNKIWKLKQPTKEKETDG